jgi:PEP-CTERM motif
MKNPINYLAGLGLAVMLSSATAPADTLPLGIFITDLTDGMPKVVITGGGTDTECSQTNEHVACGFLFPSGTLGRTDVVRAEAVLLEPAGENEGGQGPISDEVRISIIPGTPKDTLVLTFESDRPGFAFPPGLEDNPLAVAELANGNILTKNFFDATTGQPVGLPTGLSVSVQSDVVVPEPSTLLLTASGLAGIFAAQRHRLIRH